MVPQTATSPSNKNGSGFRLSLSFISTTVMVMYLSLSMFGLYRLMFPLSMIDLSKYQYPQDFLHPLWKADGASSRSDMHMRVYLSTAQSFSLKFLEANSSTPAESLRHVLLWDQKLDSASLSKMFLLTNYGGDEIDERKLDASYNFAVDWINRTEKLNAMAESDGDLLSKLSAASGHGIESTSFLLMFYQSVSKRLRSIFNALTGTGLKSKSDNESTLPAPADETYTAIEIPPTSPIWMALQSNSTLFLHVLVLHAGMSSDRIVWPPTSIESAEKSIRQASASQALLMGNVNLIKYDIPNHIIPPRRALYRDLLYYWNRYILASREMPPWEMAYYKPDEYRAHQQSLEWKQRGMGYPYWKPEVSIKFVNDNDSYPSEYAHTCGMPVVQVGRTRNGNQQHPTGHAFLPALHVDEMGMTSDKYIPVNSTVTSLPLRISFDRNDMEQQRKVTTATAGGISPARWRLLSHLSQALEKQKDLGFDDADIDEIKRLIADTNITLLTITMLASALHLLFEFLTFKSEVSFWQKNKDLTGLSVRSLFLDMVGQTIILFYLIEQQSSLLTTIPSGIGCLIALWKCERAAGLRFVKAQQQSKASWFNWLPRVLTGYELRATRLDARSTTDAGDNDAKNDLTLTRDRLIKMTIEADRLATKYLGAILLPLAWAYAIYSLLYKEHKSWYSWLITSLASTVYALGFVLMTPQLFLNWKLKSVAHLPWRVLVYKSLNTFIDDLFSFIIRMPTMARISCFRDDVVFFIYLYQRWLYPVDASRPMEGGGDGEQMPNDPSNAGTTVPSSKKKQ